jgi:CheY-like chemotaxis protein
VWVRVAREKADAVLSVRDDGIGMNPELVPRVFDLFTQGERGLDRSEGGLGIGLTLVERLVALHGGRVRAHSAGLGMGSEFVVWLPAAKASAEGARPAAAEPEPSSGRRLRILVVDDNRDATETTAVLFRLWGYDVATAVDGAAALATVAREHPDVVLLDIGLPGIDGYEVARRIRAGQGTKAPVLVAVTGYGQVDDRQRSSEAGFDRHLVKPVEPAALKRLLTDIAASLPR